MIKSGETFIFALIAAAGFGWWAWRQSVETTHASLTVDADFKACESALMIYALNAGTLPHTPQGLTALCDQPDTHPLPKRWVRIMSRVPNDPWGQPYQYNMREQDGIQHVELRSWGRDGILSEDDEIHVFSHPSPPGG